MSFSSNIKEELCKSIPHKRGKKSCLTGMLFFSANGDKYILSTEYLFVFTLFDRLAAKYLSQENDFIAKSEWTFPAHGGYGAKGINKYILTLNTAGREYFSYLYSDFIADPSGFFDKHGLDRGMFGAGAFLAAGSVNDPEKDYHMEISTADEQLAAAFNTFLNESGIKSGLAHRQGKAVVYIKGSEGIEDSLTLMGAKSAVLELMNLKILKDVRNRANRIVNCDNANIARTLKASQKQVEDIEFIMAQGKLEELSPELRDIALVRLENPDASLSELGGLLEKPVGRSGVNHRLQKLSKLADELRTN